MVEKVIDNRAIKVATKPSKGIPEPISIPNTNKAPTNPKNPPIHCFSVIFSFKKGPLRILVKIGWSVTIKAAKLVGIPIEIE